ncbi:MAG: ROK family protein [Chloroflexi bacterium]|jgi:glucokinase|nr:ROK family protein [Chloroflexota bacterium]
MDARSQAIGIDVGGTKVIVALIDGTGVVRDRVTMATHEPAGAVAGAAVDGTGAVTSPADDLVSRIAAAAADLVRAAVVVPVGVGCATTGHVDAGAGTVLHSGLVPGWSGFALREKVRRALINAGLPELPVAVDNDGHAMAIAEARFGAARGHDHAICVAVGTGVGGGFILDGQLYRGRRGLAGLVGHSTIAYRGRRCQCGKRGCLEAYAAGPRIVDEYRRLVRAERLGARTPTVARLQDVCARAEAGDRVATLAIQRGGEHLGAGLASLANALNPSVIVIGGGVLGAGPLWFDAARGTIMARTRHTVAAGLEVVPAALGSDAVVIGAGLMGMEAVAA